MSEEVRDQAPEPSKTDPPFINAWRYVEPMLELTALIADHKQHEGLAFTARALVVLGKVVVSLLGRGDEDH